MGGTSDIDALRAALDAPPGKRRRRPREEAPQTIVPVLDPAELDAARERLRAQAAPAPAADGAADPADFDAARERLRARGRRKR